MMRNGECSPNLAKAPEGHSTDRFSPRREQISCAWAIQPEMPHASGQIRTG